MKIINLIAHEEGVEVRTDESEFTDAEVIDILIAALIGEAEAIAENHECDDEHCCVKERSKEIVDALKVTIDLHNIRHRHEK